MKKRYRSGLDRLLQGDVVSKFIGPAGLITNHTGRDQKFHQNLDQILNNFKLNAQFQIKKIFAPEHGFRGSNAAGETVQDSIDKDTGLPIISLYGKDRRPKAEDLEGLETLIFDIQDVGTRFYTYISTLIYCLEAARENDLNFIILDRYNPLGREVEGNILDPYYKSFIGAVELPYRHGMTIGELAIWAIATGKIDGPERKKLEVVELTGWTGETCLEIERPWLPPSPNLPSPNSALLYPLTAVFEGTNLSEGRGTALPFQVIGAPWLDNRRLVMSLRGKELAGLEYRPLTFHPRSSKFKSESCKGIQVFITDYDKVDTLTAGLTIMAEISKLHPDKFEFFQLDDGRYFIDLLLGTDEYRKSMTLLTKNQEVDFQAELAEYLAEQAADLVKFRDERDKYLLY